MRKYCKAYLLKDLRQFNAWKEIHSDNEAELTDDTLCYIWDDFTVASSPIQEKSVIFDTVTSQWQNFCQTTLQFAIPIDLHYAYERSAIAMATVEA